MRSLILLFSLLFIACIVNAQNVGINTTTPETKLHVVDVFDVADGASGTFINVQNATLFSPIGTLAGIRFRTDGVNTGGSNHRYKGAILFEKTGSFGVGSLHFVINGVASNTSVTTSDIKMTINSIGNVGVGTTDPDQAKLQVQGAVNTNLFQVSPTGTTPGIAMTTITTSPTLQFNEYYATGYKFMGNGYAGMFQFSPSTGDLNYYCTNASGLAGATASHLGSFFTLDAAGRLGISTSAPTAKFHVNGNMVIGIGGTLPATGYSLSVDGKIICEEARVQLNTDWPDYVFSDSYNLTPLDELEKIIRQQKHLPNIPPASTVQKEGFDLGGMNIKLLEKVEELTLYIIELEKKNKAFESRIQKLENNHR